MRVLLGNNSQKKTDREKAQAMVVAFIYVSIVSLIAIYMMAYAHNLHRVVIREIKHSMSFYAAEGALIRVMSMLELDTVVPSPMNMDTDPMSIVIETTLVGTTRRIKASVNWL